MRTLALQNAVGNGDGRIQRGKPGQGVGARTGAWFSLKLGCSEPRTPTEKEPDLGQHHSCYIIKKLVKLPVFGEQTFRTMPSRWYVILMNRFPVPYTNRQLLRETKCSTFTSYLLLPWEVDPGSVWGLYALV